MQPVTKCYLEINFYILAVKFDLARSQKSAMGGLYQGSGAMPPLPEAKVEPPALGDFVYILQNKLNFRHILVKINAFKTRHKKLTGQKHD